MNYSRPRSFLSCGGISCCLSRGILSKTRPSLVCCAAWVSCHTSMKSLSEKNKSLSHVPLYEYFSYWTLSFNSFGFVVAQCGRESSPWDFFCYFLWIWNIPTNQIDHNWLNKKCELGFLRANMQTWMILESSCLWMLFVPHACNKKMRKMKDSPKPSLLSVCASTPFTLSKQIFRGFVVSESHESGVWQCRVAVMIRRRVRPSWRCAHCMDRGRWIVQP